MGGTMFCLSIFYHNSFDLFASLCLLFRLIKKWRNICDRVVLFSRPFSIFQVAVFLYHPNATRLSFVLINFLIWVKEQK